MITTYQQFQERIIDDGGRFVRWNRTASERIIELAVKTWDDNPQRDGMEARIRKQYRDHYEFGSLTIILVGILIQILVKVILTWLYGNNDTERTQRSNLVWKFRRELEHNGGWISGDH